MESKAGVRPDADDVAEFLAGLGRPVIFEAPWRSSNQSSKEFHSAVSPTYCRQTLEMSQGLRIGNPRYSRLEIRATGSVSQHPDAQGRKRRIPHSPFEIRSSAFAPVATNLNKVLKKTIIRVAAEAAGLKFGKDVIVEF